MYRHSSLTWALALSLLLHAAVLGFAGRLPSFSQDPRAPKALRVKLVEPVSVPVVQPMVQPALLRREDTPQKAVPTPPQKPDRMEKRLANDSAMARMLRPPESRPAMGEPKSRALVGEAARKASEQLARQLFYPPEAIAMGLEGETLVLLFLDETGKAIAARLEGSSGHAVLDQAALEAARTLHSLPASAPREVVVPVRFKLR